MEEASASKAKNKKFSERAPFKTEGNWYKGNLHTHTTGSDGDRSPAEIAAHYRAQGYDFLAITDHGKVTDIAGLSHDDFLVLPGAELSASGAEFNYGYHLVAVNIWEVDGLASNMDAQDVINAINAKSGIAIVAHPYWSALTIHDLMRLEGYIGIEVYNTSCWHSIGKGHSMIHWDALLSKGRNVWGMATDDVHWHFNDHRPVDACGGWVMVKAPALTEQNIVNALRAGQFYASSGPTIEDITVSDEIVAATVSPSRAIHFICDNGRGEAFTSPEGKPITSAEFKPKGKEKFLRIQTVAPDGGMAWSNPLWVGGAPGSSRPKS
ncbi:MAG: CehA/McbA family metallohydrolase [Planctomycetota bacterium]